MFSFNRIFRTFETSSRKYSRSRKLKKVLVFYSLIRTFNYVEGPFARQSKLKKAFYFVLFSLIRTFAAEIIKIYGSPRYVYSFLDSELKTGSIK